MRFFWFFILLIFSGAATAQTFSALDARARRAPASEAQTPEQLVSYLTRDLAADEQKARVLAMWIAYQVQRDGYRHKQLIQYSTQGKSAPLPPPHDPLKTRLGTPHDFAALFQLMGTLAGLQVVTIQGYAGHSIQASRYHEPLLQAVDAGLRSWRGFDYRLQRYFGAWNAVYANDKWQLIDTYWMIAGELRAGQDIQSDREMERFLEKRAKRAPSLSELAQSKRIDERYFFASPRFFVKTHYPTDSRWQLLPIPVSWAAFTSP